MRYAGLNIHALKKFPEEFSPERIVFLEKTYRDLFRSKTPLSQSIESFKKSTEPLLRAFFENWSGVLINH